MEEGEVLLAGLLSTSTLTTRSVTSGIWQVVDTMEMRTVAHVKQVGQEHLFSITWNMTIGAFLWTMLEQLCH